jgi:vancomycin permeability regulator SanA
MPKTKRGEDKIFRKKPMKVVCHRCYKRFIRYGTNEERLCLKCWEKARCHNFDSKKSKEEISKRYRESNARLNALINLGQKYSVNYLLRGIGI